MRADQDAKFEGVRFSLVNSITDSRGSFVKFNPGNDLHETLDSVALSFNPTIATVRGLHFQVEPYAEEKLITCVQGSVFDVIVDLRPNSQTFGEWTSFELSSNNMVQVYLPKGFAHGFQTLLPETIIHYALSASYSPESSFSINPFGELGIDWPLKTQLVSDRDSEGVPFKIGAQKYAESLKRD